MTDKIIDHTGSRAEQQDNRSEPAKIYETAVLELQDRRMTDKIIDQTRCRAELQKML